MLKEAFVSQSDSIDRHCVGVGTEVILVSDVSGGSKLLDDSCIEPAFDISQDIQECPIYDVLFCKVLHLSCVLTQTVDAVW
jgi:hypothetical protein